MDQKAENSMTMPIELDAHPMDWLTYGKRKDAGGEKWAIYIDVEGFGTLLKSDDPNKVGRALQGLRRLTTALFNVAATAYPGRDPGNPFERLFMHQFGDGYLIWPDFCEDELERPILICVAIMRSLICAGIAIKTAISFGSLSDLFGIYGADIRNRVDNRGNARPGHGLMTFTPALGTALDNAYKLGSAMTGAQLVVDFRAIGQNELPTWLGWAPTTPTNSTWGIVDWVHGTSARLERFCQVSGLTCPNSQDTERHLESYMSLVPMPPEKWRQHTLASAGLNIIR
jgi:hypothetical protein